MGKIIKVKLHTVYEESYEFKAEHFDNIAQDDDESLKQAAMMVSREGDHLNNSVMVGLYADATLSTYSDTVEVCDDGKA